MGYDVHGRKTYMNDPDMGVWTYLYDDNGNLIEQKDAEGHYLCFWYDGLNRMTTKGTYTSSCAIQTLPAVGVTNWLATWTYDSATNGMGLLEKVEWYNRYKRHN